jgi:hypothetical protein
MVETDAVLTCPFCGERSEHEMPIDRCQIVLICPHCNERITPKAGDCCVFCSYADKPCPPLQA